MNKITNEIANAARRDCEAVPMPNLKPIAKRLGFVRRKQLPNAAAILAERPGDAAATELFLLHLLSWTKRQIGGAVALGPTFVQTVAEIGDDVLAALPAHSRAALSRLSELAAQSPVEIGSLQTTAHALAIDGSLAAWLGTDDAKSTQTKPTNPQRTYRRLAQQFHPDKGGNPETMQALNALWKAVKQSA